MLSGCGNKKANEYDTTNRIFFKTSSKRFPFDYRGSDVALICVATTGLVNLFVKHTSCVLSINENYDPSVRSDMEQIYNRLVRENESYYQHTDEGSDDMPSHAKCSLTGVSLTIPVTGGKLNLGTWQGIYLCEFRDYGGPRRIVATIMG